jgi:signal transduction histidine kinase
MDWRRRKRQLLLVLIAILLPAGVLVSLAVRVFRQEAELAEKRMADVRRDALVQLRREVAAKLEAIKLQEVDHLRDEPRLPITRRPPGSAVVFVVPLEQDRMVMPWDERRRPEHPSPQYDAFRRRGEALEFLESNAEAAAEAYREAFRFARGPAEKCEAQLWMARSLLKTGKAEEGADIYHTMLSSCGSVRDDDGIPFSLYAAERLVSNQLDAGGARQYVAALAAQPRWWSPMQAYLMRTLLGDIPALSSEIHDMEQMVALAADLHGAGLFRLDIPFSERPGETAWLGYGTEPWLVTVMSPGEMASSVVLAISSTAVTPPGATLVPRNSTESDPLGEGFIDVDVQWEAGRFEHGAQRLPAGLYAAGLALILGATALAGYLLLRDVNRETRMADMRSHFVASVSHELKTPLTAIRMFAETLALGRSRDEGTRTEYLQTIVNESERLSRLVDNVLDFSRIERGNKIYRMLPASLVDVVHSAARAMQYPLAQLGFHLELTIDGLLPELALDVDAMEQAILNLLTNAMKYSGDSRRIELRLHPAGSEAVVEISDHGVGIREDDLDRIFEKFYRVRSPDTDLVAGTGLGLTLAMHIVKAHGGRLEVASTLGKGSIFSIVLPLHRAKAAT